MKRWRPKRGERYYYIEMTETGYFEVFEDERNTPLEDGQLYWPVPTEREYVNFRMGNCFRTMGEARKKIKQFLKVLKGGK